MANIRPGRFVANHDEDFSVFTVGMRINRLWKVHKWWPVFVSMPRKKGRRGSGRSGCVGNGKSRRNNRDGRHKYGDVKC